MKDKLKELNDSNAKSQKNKEEFNKFKPKIKLLLGFLWNSEKIEDVDELEKCNKKSEKRIKELEQKLESSSTTSKDAGKSFRNGQKESINSNKTRNRDKQKNNILHEKNNNEHTME